MLRQVTFQLNDSLRQMAPARSSRMRLPGAGAGGSMNALIKYRASGHVLNVSVKPDAAGKLRSVTVVAESGLLADGLSTALFVMGYDKGEALWRESDDFECIWLFSDGSVRLTQGLEQAASGCAFTVVRR